MTNSRIDEDAIRREHQQLTDKVQEVDHRLRSARNDLNEAEKRNDPGTSPAEVTKCQQRVDGLENEKIQAEARLTALESRLTAEHPELAAELKEGRRADNREPMSFEDRASVADAGSTLVDKAGEELGKADQILPGAEDIGGGPAISVLKNLYDHREYYAAKGEAIVQDGFSKVAPEVQAPPEPLSQEEIEKTERIQNEFYDNRDEMLPQERADPVNMSPDTGFNARDQLRDDLVKRMEARGDDAQKIEKAVEALDRVLKQQEEAKQIVPPTKEERHL
jgi:hypothetical protein